GEGDLIAEVEDPSGMEAEIVLQEQEVTRVEVGQRVELKARALPFHGFQGKVDRIATAATRGDLQSTVTVYCRLEDPAAELRSGMSGYARVSCGSRCVGGLLLDRVLRYLRTEFWW